MTYKEIVYMVLDEIKGKSDDFTYTEDHVIFLMKNYRVFLLKQKYEKEKKWIDESNYQTICLDLEKVEAIEGLPCIGGYYLKTTKQIPSVSNIGSTRIYSADNYYLGNITFVSRDRFKFVGNNRWLKNIIFASRNPNGYLYLTSQNPQFLYLKAIQMTAIFDDPEEAEELACDTDTACDILDRDFPLETALVPSMIELMVKELLGASYRPDDSYNNASDDMANLAAYISRNAKSNVQKQIEG